MNVVTRTEFDMLAEEYIPRSCVVRPRTTVQGQEADVPPGIVKLRTLLARQR